MFGFFIKKWFFDFWDNMIKIVLLNLGFIALLGVVVYVPFLLRFSTALSIVSAAIVIVFFNLYVGGAARFTSEIADYDNPGFKDFIEYVKEVWKSTIVLSIVSLLQLFLVVFAMPFYISLGGTMGLIALSIIFWASVVWWLAFQYYFPVRSRLDSNLKKVLKKSFLLLFDNTGFSLGMAIFSLIVLALSVFTALLLPGFASILLLHQVGTKLRLYKYDYLEENPDANRKNIPWDSLLYDEKERVGHRSLKGMIFPWKE
jgi:uncharacterized membrane protein YesL